MKFSYDIFHTFCNFPTDTTVLKYAQFLSDFICPYASVSISKFRYIGFPEYYQKHDVVLKKNEFQSLKSEKVNFSSTDNFFTNINIRGAMNNFCIWETNRDRRGSSCYVYNCGVLRPIRMPTYD